MVNAVNRRIMLRRFYAPQAAEVSQVFKLDADESHHLRDVLRLGAEDRVTVFDGKGSEFVCAIHAVDRHSATLEILSKEIRRIESPIQITLCQALAKGEKFDLIVQKATELGVHQIIPLLTAHSDVKPDEKSISRKMERWKRIAMEAVKQSTRTRIVEIETPSSLTAAVKTQFDIKYIFAERGGSLLRQQTGDVPIQPQTLAIFIGPEGGWQREEIAAARDNNCQIVTVGPRILRTETAAITAISLIQYLFGDLSQPIDVETT